MAVAAANRFMKKQAEELDMSIKPCRGLNQPK